MTRTCVPDAFICQATNALTRTTHAAPLPAEREFRLVVDVGNAALCHALHTLWAMFRPLPGIRVVWHPTVATALAVQVFPSVRTSDACIVVRQFAAGMPMLLATLRRKWTCVPWTTAMGLAEDAATRGPTAHARTAGNVTVRLLQRCTARTHTLFMRSTPTPGTPLFWQRYMQCVAPELAADVLWACVTSGRVLAVVPHAACAAFAVATGIQCVH